MQTLIKTPAFWISLVVVAAVVWYVATNYGYAIGVDEGSAGVAVE